MSLPLYVCARPLAPVLDTHILLIMLLFMLLLLILFLFLFLVRFVHFRSVWFAFVPFGSRIGKKNLQKNLWKSTPSVTFGDSSPMPFGTGEPFGRQKPALFCRKAEWGSVSMRLHGNRI